MNPGGWSSRPLANLKPTTSSSRPAMTASRPFLPGPERRASPASSSTPRRTGTLDRLPVAAFWWLGREIPPPILPSIWCEAVRRRSGTQFARRPGSSLQPDVVVAATGYRRGLERLVGNLGVLDERGRPITSGAESPDGLSGLYFAGYTNPLSGNLRELGIHARQIADQIATSPRSA